MKEDPICMNENMSRKLALYTCISIDQHADAYLKYLLAPSQNIMGVPVHYTLVPIPSFILYNIPSFIQNL